MITAQEAREFKKNYCVDSCLKIVENEIISKLKGPGIDQSIHCGFSFYKDEKAHFKEVVSKLEELGYSVKIKEQKTFDKVTFYFDIIVSW